MYLHFLKRRLDQDDMVIPMDRHHCDPGVGRRKNQTRLQGDEAGNRDTLQERCAAEFHIGYAIVAGDTLPCHPSYQIEGRVFLDECLQRYNGSVHLSSKPLYGVPAALAFVPLRSDFGDRRRILA